MAEEFVYLPEECWELIFSFLLRRRHGHHFESLSLVCKQFLSITNNLRTTLTISELTVPVIPQIFSRFRRIKRIDLQNFRGVLGRLLLEIAESGLDLESLNISNQEKLPLTLKVFGKRMLNLRSLKCSGIGFLADEDLVMIAESFPNLEELDFSYPKNTVASNSMSRAPPSLDSRPVITDLGIFALITRLPRLCKVNLSGNSFITDRALVALTVKCQWLKEIEIRDCKFITQVGLAAALCQNPNLTSISANDVGIPSFHMRLLNSFVSMKNLSSLNLAESDIPNELLYSIAEASLPLKKLVLSRCHSFSFSGISVLLEKNQSIEWLDLEAANFLTDHSVGEISQFLRRVKFINLSNCSNLTCFSLFTLARKCHTLNEIKLKNVNLEKEDNYTIDFTNPRVVTLDLSENRNLRDESLRKSASIFPNLELLKLNYCAGISGESIRGILRKCTKMRHLEVNLCSGIKNLAMDSELPALEALRLQGLGIEDESLAVVGRRCPCLIHLDLKGCLKVSEEGVKETVRNCRGLREINLWRCGEVDGSVVPWMVFSRPSLRKIIPPKWNTSSENQRKLFLRHGCLVLYEMHIIHWIRKV